MPSRLALGVVLVLAFGTLAAAQLTVPYLFRQGSIASTQSLERALTLDADVMPGNIAGLRRVGFAELRPEVHVSDPSVIRQVKSLDGTSFPAFRQDVIEILSSYKMSTLSATEQKPGEGRHAR